MPFERSFTDAARQCPVWAGPARLMGSRLIVQLPQGDAEINAPRALLRHVVAACNGTRSIDEIAESVQPVRAQSKAKSFVSDLLKAGVLVDASLYTVAAQKFAWVPNPFGNAADRSVWLQVPRRFSLLHGEQAEATGPEVKTPIDPLVEKRLSIHTFDTRPLTEETLRSYLWLFAGVVREKHERLGIQVPRRTIPSGGAVHALRAYLVLRSSVGELGPGVYTVSYPAVRRVALKRLNNDVSWLPRAVTHPWYLSFATGMVFLVADPRLGAIKYRSRALQYLFIEAGAAMQNASLASSALGIGMSLYGGYVETAVSEPLQLDAQDVILSSAVFGSAPSAQQLKQEKIAPKFEFEWADSQSARYTMPYFLARCRVEANDTLQSETWGRAQDPWIAYVKSAVESIERLGFRSPRNIRQGKLSDWDAVLDPRSLTKYSEVQYRDASFPLKPFSERAVCGWTPGRSLQTGKTTMVLAEQVFAASVLRRVSPSALAKYDECNSSGCGAHLDERRALNAALLELIERDAFMRSWLLQQAGIAIRLDSLPSAQRRRVRALEKLGCRLTVQRLPSRWAPVAVAYAQHEALHFSVVGAAARIDLEGAIEGALDELETLAYVRFHDQQVPAMTPEAVRTPAHHTSLYALRRYFRRVDPLMRSRQSGTFSRLASEDTDNDDIPQRLLDAGWDIVTADIAPLNSAIDQGRTPIVVLRALVPGLIPMSFGYNREPLGLLKTFDRRGRFPHPFP